MDFYAFIVSALIMLGFCYFLSDETRENNFLVIVIIGGSLAPILHVIIYPATTEAIIISSIWTIWCLFWFFSPGIKKTGSKSEIKEVIEVSPTIKPNVKTETIREKNVETKPTIRTFKANTLTNPNSDESIKKWIWKDNSLVNLKSLQSFNNKDFQWDSEMQCFEFCDNRPYIRVYEEEVDFGKDIKKCTKCGLPTHIEEDTWQRCMNCSQLINII